jgi:hypothetical protein
MALHLEKASFPKLHSGQNKPSDGTVTGTGLSKGLPVNINEKHGNRTWAGTIGDQSRGTTWNATVKRSNHDKDDSQKDLETVTVTVTSGPDSSNVDTDSEIVP